MESEDDVSKNGEPMSEKETLFKSQCTSFLGVTVAIADS